jgi:hypothetical protein
MSTRKKTKRKSLNIRKKPVRISARVLKEIYDKIKINPIVVPPGTLRRGIKVELEHGLSNYKTNVTNDDLLITAKIALAHIYEFPDYYDRLEEMERRAEEEWKGRRKPDIFL